MKQLMYFSTVLFLLFGACSEDEAIIFPDTINGPPDTEITDTIFQVNTKNITQRAEVYSLFPDFDISNADNVMVPTNFSPQSSGIKAELERRPNSLRFRIFFDEVSDISYQLYYVIFNNVNECNASTDLGDCGGFGGNDYYLPSTAVVKASGKIKWSEHRGVIEDVLMNHNHGDKLVYMGNKLSSALQNPLQAEVRVIFKLNDHGPQMVIFPTPLK